MKLDSQHAVLLVYAVVTCIFYVGVVFGPKGPAREWRTHGVGLAAAILWPLCILIAFAVVAHNEIGKRQGSKS